ncbi:septum formation initiator family protein [Bacteroides sp. 51]|uniref:FtsB family cell division protein n=1 Tax=Bacteroides sp. 51 TaxID=2302938 RepID=UPI0013D6AD9C|nr:septum formation initiator family protein [Bacteroides sp. 51]NDV83605.1 septum formation initiator family protein [Bacteroides sp. 51]
MDKLLNVWDFIGKHKYLITVIVFGVIIGFLDENSVVRRMQYTQEINTLNKEIEKYRTQYEESTARLNELVTNPEAIEQIAREKYRMKKPNEDIYVFEN